MKNFVLPDLGAITKTAAALPDKKNFRLGIMGGTFNPVHYGHLLCAEQARCKFHLDEVVFVPSGVPPHKEGAAIAPAQHRYNMTLLATSTNPHFTISRCEIDRKGPSYAVDTISYFLERHKKKRPKIYFITGCDAVMEIFSWRSPEQIIKMATIIAASRPGYDIARLKSIVGPSTFRKIRLLEASALAISSTDIRCRINDGRPIRYLLPETVEQYIRKHGLYIKEK